VALGSWELGEDVISASSPEEAVEAAFGLIEE
jgi:hypothetical protein